MAGTSSIFKKGAAMSVVIILCVATSAVAELDVPCFFIFGDSLIDNGNNNNNFIFLNPAKFWPYGIDFPVGPTGRYSNGRTVADIIGELLGFDDFIPPYSSAGGNQILRGVNYGAAAAGIRRESGHTLTYRTYFGEQVKNFNNTVAQIMAILGDRNEASNHLAKCIYFVEMGINDFINNYFQPIFYNTSLYYSIPQYTTLLIQEYSHQLRIMYGYGARKFALVGLLPFGCSPVMLAFRRPGVSNCDEGYNLPIHMFNKKLIALVDDLNTNFPAARFTYINSYDIAMDVLDDPSTYGFEVTNAACCGKEEKYKLKITCDLNKSPCENRDEYLFWDFVHPSEAAAKVLAKRAHRAQNPSDTYPFDISILAHLQI